MPGLAGEVANLIVALKLDDSGFSGKLNAAARQLKGMDAGLSQMGRGVGQVGSGLSRLGTVAAGAAAGGLAAVVTTAASFEQAFTGVEKTVDGTDAQLAELEGTFREMARSMPVSFEQLSSIGEAGGALGIAREDLEEFTDVVARLSVSTDLSADAAATSLGQLGNVLHLQGPEFQEFGDMLVALGNNGASTESQIVEMAARFGAAGNSAGLTTAEILGLSSAVASMGIEVEAGGSSLSRIFGNVATAIGTGGDEVKAFTDLLGISAKEFKERWSEDALGTFEDFLVELGKLDQFGQAKVLEEAGITGVRDINAVRLMAQNVGFLSDQLETAETAQGALRTESDKFFNTTTGQWQILKNNVRDALAQVGTALLPSVNQGMKEFVTWLNEAGTQQGIKNFAKDLADGVSNLVKELKGTDFSGIIDGMKLAAQVAKGAFDAFRSLPAPIQQLAIAALVANKVSGGAVGQIAKGLGNILLGGGKIGAGLFGNRGATPANPLFVQQVGGIGGGPGGVAGGKGGGGLLGAATTALGALTAATVAKEVDDWLGQDLKQSDLEWPFGPKNTPTILPEIFGGNGLLGGTAGGASGAGRARGGRFDDDDAASFDRFGGKLDKLATNEVIEHLSRTTEVGLKDVGTSFQTGIKTGMDPLGDIATQILARAEDPKAPAVMTEIKGHISGLEEIQAQYLANGDVKLAEKVQRNIDTLHGLVGTVDQVRSVTKYHADRALSNDASLLQISRNANLFNSRTAAATEATSRKNFDPKITNYNNITVPVNVSVNTSVIQRQIYTLRTTTGSGGFI